METHDTHEKGIFIRHVPCKQCGSSDACAEYTDHIFCFACNHYHDLLVDEHSVKTGVNSNEINIKTKNTAFVTNGECKALSVRGIHQETCQRFQYLTAKNRSGTTVQVEQYRDKKGNLVAQKTRDKNKQFKIIGNSQKMPLFAQYRYSGEGDRLVITEGAMDAMSVSQAFGHKHIVVVSVPNGAQSAKKSILDNLDFVLGYSEICLFFDGDTPGKEATKSCIEVLPLGRVSVASMQDYKDANEALADKNPRAIIDAIMNATKARPDGIVLAEDLRDIIVVRDDMSAIRYPYTRLNELTMGIQPSTMITLCAGSGVGKSTLIRELAYTLHQANQVLGMIMLEETNKRTLQGLVGIHLSKNIINFQHVATDEQIVQAHSDLFTDRPLFLYDHMGTRNIKVIKNHIHWMVAHGAKVIILDHISMLISEATSKVQDERRLIDTLMTDFRSLVQELGITLFLISHLKRPTHGAHEDGTAKIDASQLRGSGAIVQLSDICIGLSVDPDDVSTLRQIVVLKNRHTGQVGYADKLCYDRHSGRLKEVTEEFVDVPF